MTGGLLALAVFLAAVAVLSVRAGSPGPGTVTVVGYGIAAVAVVSAQRWIDRRPGPVGTLAAGVLALLTAAGLAFQWLS
ncbi:MAG TPA: hypothetical protein VD813_13125 [Pseudonocardia sp.]|nr:hypothetical protein [Pseudonocardia sp.]